ncbi:glycosyltransferase [Methylophaga sp.]|uniref:glycosyltransferase n=1 Tax=Methylophaga sp. TaxID=2024840 RepID=UPI003A947487
MKIEKEEKCIFLTWEIHTRSRSVSRELGIPIFEVIHADFFFTRYYRSIVDTFRILKDERPDIVIFQNPSMILAVFLVIFALFVKLDLIMDAHNAAISPCEGRFWLLNKISSVLVSKVKLTIVTNEIIGESVKEKNGRPFVLEDPIPKLDVSKNVQKTQADTKKVVFVCSWAEDEPYMEVIKAFKSLSDKSIVMFITGRPPDHMLNKSIPNNVQLTGFLLEQDYINLLAEANLIIDLTDRPDCLVCGAYEAAAVGTPCIVSDNLCSSETFYQGYVYSKNDFESIISSIEYAIEHELKLKLEIELFCQEYKIMNNKKIQHLKNYIYSV